MIYEKSEFIFILLFEGLFVFQSCKKSDTKWTESGSSGPPTCVQVLDADSKTPIQGVTFYGLDSGWFGADTVINTLTDVNGKVCNIPKEVDYIKVMKNGYLTAVFQSIRPAKIELRKPSYAYLHIRNDSVALSSDYVSVIYYQNYNLGYPTTINLNGLADTIIFVCIDPVQQMDWIHNNASTYLHKSINITGGDTVNVDFFY